MNSLQRRALLFAVVCAFLQSAPVAAQSYPAKTIRLVVPGATGGSPDIIARILAPALGEALGQGIIIDNVAGAAGIIGTDKVAKALPDGYTLLYGFNQIATMNPSLYANLPYQPERDLAPIGQVLNLSYALIASSTFRAKNLTELIALSKAKPGSVSYASTGGGSAAHLGVIMIEQAAGIEMLHVPYKASSVANTDVIGGVVDIRLDAIAASLTLVKGGKLKALAVTTSQRSPALPNVPTVAETLPGFELTGWHGIWAPAQTSPAIIQKVNVALLAVLSRPEIRAQITALAFEPAGSTPEQMTERIRRETRQWASIVKAAKITPQ
ncbi:tripartite tricarboxylate transporter substrate binding protein [Variovorax paradoxus]|nr:tripartite tricarboxylate transporter substrate binding protein [Variovorax paradoxus]MBT2305105.1 tripartite tricarboxylate transporter substrate binding protein [Variovorax paradoxus]